MKSLIVNTAAIFALGFSYAQIEDAGPVNNPADGIIDGVVLKEHVPTKRMIPYEFVREADVMWMKRVWQTIDLRERMNHTLYYPHDEITPAGEWVKHGERWSLWTIIRHNIINGKLTVFLPYNPNNQFSEWDGDQLKYPLYPQQGLTYFTDSVYREKLVYCLGKMGPQSDVPEVDEYGDPIIITLPDGTESFKYPPADTLWYTSKDIIQYRIKEEWFFDKERSVLDQRILALAPVVYQKGIDAQGNESISGTMELFWLYFPHCRFVFNNYFSYNDKNDAQWMSFDDLFWKRRFTSFIYKESNGFDRKIETYRSGVDALRESERIKEEIRTFEHDVWDY
ncbi:MAG: gliding motility protein GldN [Crocinitomicaceae bacterium]|nr:gliding motility protein GldN [Crocinitomicaceae bacterium]